jgi:hypothetical protein
MKKSPKTGGFRRFYHWFPLVGKSKLKSADVWKK